MRSPDLLAVPDPAPSSGTRRRGRARARHRDGIRAPRRGRWPIERPRWGVAVGSVALALAACAGAEPDAALDTGTAAVLADRAERVADLLDADEPCLADAEVADLRARTEDQRAAGAVPDEVAAEVLAVLEELDDAIACDADGADPAGEPADDAADDDQQEGEGRTDEDATEEAPVDETDDREDEGDGNRGRGRGQGDDRPGRGSDPPGRGSGRG